MTELKIEAYKNHESTPPPNWGEVGRVAAVGKKQSI